MCLQRSNTTLAFSLSFVYQHGCHIDRFLAHFFGFNADFQICKNLRSKKGRKGNKIIYSFEWTLSALLRDLNNRSLP